MTRAMGKKTIANIILSNQLSNIERINKILTFTRVKKNSIRNHQLIGTPTSSSLTQGSSIPTTTQIFRIHKTTAQISITIDTQIPHTERPCTTQGTGTTAQATTCQPTLVYHQVYSS